MLPTDLYGVEFSRKQRAFHVETIQEALANNLMACVGLVESDGLMLAVAESRQEADRLCDRLKAMRKPELKI